MRQVLKYLHRKFEICHFCPTEPVTSEDILIVDREEFMVEPSAAFSSMVRRQAMSSAATLDVIPVMNEAIAFKMIPSEIGDELYCGTEETKRPKVLP